MHNLSNDDVNNNFLDKWHTWINDLQKRVQIEDVKRFEKNELFKDLINNAREEAKCKPDLAVNNEALIVDLGEVDVFFKVSNN